MRDIHSSLVHQRILEAQQAADQLRLVRQARPRRGLRDRFRPGR